MIKIQKRNINIVIGILRSLRLTPFDSAVRNRLVTKLVEASKESQQIIDDISSQFIPKDENGDPIWVVGYVDANGQVVPDPKGDPIPNAWVCPEDQRQEFHEQTELELSDEWSLGEVSENVQESIKRIISNPDILVKGREAEVLEDLQTQLGLLDELDF